MGKIIANDADGYRYLAESIRKHRDQETLLEMVEDAGFVDCRYHNMTGGIVAVHRISGLIRWNTIRPSLRVSVSLRKKPSCVLSISLQGLEISSRPPSINHRINCSSPSVDLFVTVETNGELRSQVTAEERQL